MFQVRHIYEHNAGIIDDEFVRNPLTFNSQKGRKYPLNKLEIDSFLDKIQQLGNGIFDEVE